MSFEGLKIEESGNGEKIEKTQAETKLKEIGEIKKNLDSITDSSNPEIKQKLESNTKMQGEIVLFLEDAANNKLNGGLDKFNSQNFDKDGENGLDSFEFTNFEQALENAVEQIIKLDGVNKFNGVYEDTKDEGILSAPDKLLALALNAGENFNKDSLTIEGLKKLGISEEDLQKMSEKKFDISSSESWKEMGILLTKELGDGAEGVLKFLTNIPAGIILIPRYLNYRIESNSSNEQEATAGDIKLKELTEQNPSLALLNMLGEEGIAMIKKIGEMMTSGKQGDIAMSVVSLASLIAGGAGAIKLGSNMARKEAVMSARNAGRAGRTEAGRDARNVLRDVANVSGKVADKANKIDDTLSGMNAIKSVGKVAGGLGTNEAGKQIDAANDATNKVDNLSDSGDKEKLYYSKFSSEVPDVLKSENPVAWINLDGTISYNKGKIEKEFGVKIDGEQGNTRFDGKSLKDYIKQNPEKGTILMEKLKNLKGHEATHRVLETNGIDRVSIKIDGVDKIFGQEAICHIVDGSLPISADELSKLEKALQEKIGSDFKLESNSIRITDTKNITDKGNNASTFERKAEAAKSGGIDIKNIKDIVKSRDIVNQTEFLRNASPDELSHSFNEGLLDYISDDFSADFPNTLSEINNIYEKNSTNIGVVLKDIDNIINKVEVTPEEKSILESIVKKMSNDAIDFKESFRSITDSSGLSSLIKNIPVSAISGEVLDIVNTCVSRLAKSIDSQKDCLLAINTLIEKFPDLYKDGFLLALEHLDPVIWKENNMFKGSIKGLTLEGNEFDGLLSKMMKSNPKRFKELVDSNDNFAGIDKSISRIKQVDKIKFQEEFTFGPSREDVAKLLKKEVVDITDGDIDRVTDYNRMKVLLGEHPDTRTLNVADLSTLVGQENIDRFFHFSLERLNKIAQTDKTLELQIDKLCFIFGRDKFSGSKIIKEE